MKNIEALLKSQPALIGTIVPALLTVALALGVDPKLGAAIGGLVTVLAGVWIRAQVFTAATVVSLATDVANEAVTNVSEAAAGSVGTLTSLGATVATDAVKKVLPTILGPAAA